MGYLRRITGGSFDKDTQRGKREVYTLTDQLIAHFGMDQPVGEKFSKHVTWFDHFIVSPDSIRPRTLVQISTKHPETKRREVHNPPESQRLDDITQRLGVINSAFTEHWLDLELPQDKWSVFTKGWEDSKGRFHTLDLTKRHLYRIFHDDNLKTGGRFYGGWWQEIPDEYRPYIIIDGDQTGTLPGVLRLHDPEEEILPSTGDLVIIPASRKHSAVCNGDAPRILIGANFYAV